MIKLFYQVRKQNKLGKHDCNDKPRERDRYNKNKKYLMIGFKMTAVNQCATSQLQTVR